MFIRNVFFASLMALAFVGRTVGAPCEFHGGPVITICEEIWRLNPGGAADAGFTVVAEGNVDLVSIDVVDASNTVVLHEETTADEVDIWTENLPAGDYTVRITTSTIVHYVSLEVAHP